MSGALIGEDASGTRQNNAVQRPAYTVFAISRLEPETSCAASGRLMAMSDATVADVQADAARIFQQVRALAGDLDDTLAAVERGMWVERYATAMP